MANPEHVAILLEGVDVWNQWRARNIDTVPDLSCADLLAANLSGANLRDANLSRSSLSGAQLGLAYLNMANLSRADLNDSSLIWAYLIGTDFSGASLIGASLADANLSGANLNDADLTGANLRGANLWLTKLRGATFSEALLGGTILGETDLKNAIGLDSCTHAIPSVLDHSTLARSGPLPLAFLRGCGLPDNLIEYLPSLFNQAIQFYSCFISYSTEDHTFATRLYADLQNKGVRCWFAPHDIAGGKKIHEQIDTAIQVHDRLLLILSKDSMNSEWVKTEIAKARKRELKEKRQMLFPVGLVGYQTLQNWECFDADTGNDSAREIREYFIPDFSNWKDHDSYKAAFDRLIRDLTAKDLSAHA